ncbi:MAG: beta-glucosidase, partial [Candidatus Thorarchaeota archaeon]
ELKMTRLSDSLQGIIAPPSTLFLILRSTIQVADIHTTVAFQAHSVSLASHPIPTSMLFLISLEERIKLCAGRRTWSIPQIKRLGIKAFVMYDGPHGVRPSYKGDIKATYFPSAICRAATWNPELSHQFGISLAEEVRAVGAHMILAPGINIQRTPMCGRTFEYQTEDPYLNKILAVAVVKGIQSQKIAACVKHFICNNQETNRFIVSSEVSKRALEEIYFPAFKATVREADAWAFMSCYNKVNGIFGSEHYNLLRETLINNWGFRGFVVSDWNATHFTNTKDMITAGLSLEMPTPQKYRKRKLLELYEKGELNMDYFNDNVKRILRVMFLVGLFDNENAIPKGKINNKEHQKLALDIAQEGIVLLKNEKNILPLDINKIKNLAVIGPNKSFITSLKGGSSVNFPPYEITPLQAIEDRCKDKIAIVNNPSEAEFTILFVGLNHEPGMDCEGEDKKYFGLPKEQVNLIKRTIKENPNTIVILISGSPISMDNWIKDIPALIEAWYGGMEAGTAIANIIFGDINPSGKLPITFPKTLSDSPAHISSRTFPGNDKVYYEEGIFVGYRYFDTKNIEPLFPFGHGLSYTTFRYENIRLDKTNPSRNGNLIISVDILNDGQREGSEIVQLYIQDVHSSIERPLKELKGFKKVKLKPREKKTITFKLSSEDLSYYHEVSKSWITEEGEFNILIGASSRDIRLQTKINY